MLQWPRKVAEEEAEAEVTRRPGTTSAVMSLALLVTYSDAAARFPLVPVPLSTVCVFRSDRAWICNCIGQRLAARGA